MSHNTNDQDIMKQSISVDWASTTQQEQTEFAENFAKWQMLVLLRLSAMTASRNRLIMVLSFAAVVLLLSLFSVDTSTLIIVALGVQLGLLGVTHFYEEKIKTATNTAEAACLENLKTLSKKHPVV